MKKEQDEAKKKAQAVGDPKTFNDRYDQTVDSIQNLQKLQRAKAAEQKQMRQQLGGAAADQKDYGRQLDVDIRYEGGRRRGGVEENCGRTGRTRREGERK